MDKGLEILAEVKRRLGVPVLTDVHTEDEVAPVAAVVDVLQTPAFLCRQTDFIRAAASAGRPVNIKKGQFLAPRDMKNVVDKAREASGADNVMVCERGVSFGYNNLVSDMRSLAIMRETGCPVVFDATHSVQLPGGQGTASGGQREFVPVLARAAVASGVAGLFMETHPNPEKALSRRPERLAARADAAAAGDAGRARRAGQGRRLHRRPRQGRSAAERTPGRKAQQPENAKETTHELHRRRRRPRNSRLARQSHRRSRRAARIRRHGPRRGALGRLHRQRARRSSCATATRSASAARAC